MLPSRWSRVPGVWTEAAIWGACRGPTESGIQQTSVLPSYHFYMKNVFFLIGAWINLMLRKKKKPSRTKTAMGISVAESPISCPRGVELPPPAQLSSSLGPCSAQERHAGALKPPRSSVRSLLCCCQRTEVVSCEDEEFEVGCQSSPSSGGVWRNACWDYIKHWLMLRKHEFWKIQLRNKQNLKLHFAYKSTGTRGCWGPLKSRPWRGGFLKSCHHSQEELKAMYVCRGGNMALHYFKESQCGHFSFTHWKELPKME